MATSGAASLLFALQLAVGSRCVESSGEEVISTGKLLVSILPYIFKQQQHG